MVEKVSEPLEMITAQTSFGSNAPGSCFREAQPPGGIFDSSSLQNHFSWDAVVRWPSAHPAGVCLSLLWWMPKVLGLLLVLITALQLSRFDKTSFTSSDLYYWRQTLNISFSFINHQLNGVALVHHRDIDEDQFIFDGKWMQKKQLIHMLFATALITR